MLSTVEPVVPASGLSNALKQIREPQRILAKKPMEAEFLKCPWRSPGRENVLRKHPCCRRTSIEAGRRISRYDTLAINGSNQVIHIAQSTVMQAFERC